MMRLAVLALLLSLLASQAAIAGVHDAAPADEYFGPFKESILGIRNHLVDMERKNDTQLITAIVGIDNVEIAIEDWQRHYPRDSWLPGFLDRVVHVYARAHALASARARRALTLLEHAYPRTEEARDAASVAEVAR